MAREFRHALEEDILAAIAGVEQAATGKSLCDYQNDWLLKHAIQRAIEIISEASRALPEEATVSQPQIRWKAIRAIGNVLRHEYHGLSDAIIWNVVVDELPLLKAAILAIRREFYSP